MMQTNDRSWFCHDHLLTTGAVLLVPVWKRCVADMPTHAAVFDHSAPNGPHLGQKHA